MQLNQREWVNQLEEIRNIINNQLDGKVDYREVEEWQGYIKQKADVNLVEEMGEKLKQEIVASVQQMKKDIQKVKGEKQKKSKEQSSIQKEQDEKYFEEIRNIKDKMGKLAFQFDKELTERDRSLKQLD